MSRGSFFGRGVNSSSGFRTMYSQRRPSRCLGATDLVPDSSEGIVGKELDDVTRCEELVADGKLAAIPGRLRSPCSGSRIAVRSSLELKN